MQTWVFLGACKRCSASQSVEPHKTRYRGAKNAPAALPPLASTPRHWRVPVLFIALALTVLLTACAGSQPRINLETPEFDFGEVVNGEIVSAEVTVRNSGQADLVIETVTTTCGCTTATLEPMTIPPGKEATLHIEFDSGAHGPELTGRLMRQVILLSNDPETPEATVQFVANVLPPEDP